MSEDLKQHIKQLAEKYNVVEFIKNDPVQFPHRYREKRDIEVSAMITQWISYGNRKAIVETGNRLDALFCGSPYNYIMGGQWQEFKDNKNSLYRFYKWHDFYLLCSALLHVYREYDSLEDAIDPEGDYSVELFRHFSNVNGIPNPSAGSASKRVWMMLRWLVRRDGIVDLGIWNKLSQERLLIPVDVHVLQEAQKLGLTQRKSASILVAREITGFMAEVFPGDPVKGDFALFGLGVDK